MTSKEQNPHQRLWTVSRIAITVALVVALWQVAGGEQIVAVLSGATPVWVGAAVGCLVLQTVFSAQRWRAVAAALQQNLAVGYALREYFLSQAINQALPGAVMGDAARVFRARASNGLIIAGQAVLFERLAGQCALFAVFAGSFLATDAVAGGVDWPPALRGTFYACLTRVGVALFTLVIANHTGITPWLTPLHQALLSHKVVLRQLSLGAAITICNLSAFAFSAQAVAVDLSVSETLSLVPILLFAMLIPLTVSGWGMREGAAAFILPLADVSTTDAIAASILFGIAILVSVLPGFAIGLKQ